MEILTPNKPICKFTYSELKCFQTLLSFQLEELKRELGVETLAKVDLVLEWNKKQMMLVDVTHLIENYECK